MNNDKSPLESPNTPTFHYTNQIHYKNYKSTNKQKKK